MMGGEELVFLNTDSVAQEAGAGNETSDINMFPIEFLCSFTASGLPAGKLHLKLACPLIFLQNLFPS